MIFDQIRPTDSNRLMKADNKEKKPAEAKKKEPKAVCGVAKKVRFEVICSHIALTVVLTPLA